MSKNIHKMPTVDLYCRSILRSVRSSWSLNNIHLNQQASYATSAEEKLGLNKPKKPLSLYMRFLNQVRPTLVSKNPGVNAAGIVKLASKHWGQLSDDAKAKMNSDYEKEMEEYKKKKAAFINSLTVEQKENISKLKMEMSESKEKRRLKAELKDLGKPKKPMTSFLIFLQSQKDKVKNKTFTETVAILSERWRNMSAQEKSEYENKSKELHLAYQKELAQWEQKMIRMGNIDHVRNKALMPKNRKSAGSSE